MSRVAVIGEHPDLWGFALAGVDVVRAATPEHVRTAWHSLPADVAVVVLSAAAADALGTQLRAPGAPLTVVAPP